MTWWLWIVLALALLLALFVTFVLGMAYGYKTYWQARSKGIIRPYRGG